MARELKFQDPGEGIYEGEVLEILVSKGDEVKEGDDVLVVETDKASYEVSSPYSGTIDDIFVQTGDMIHVGDRLMAYADGTKTEKQKDKDKDKVADREAEKEEQARQGKKKSAAENGEQQAAAPREPEAEGRREKEARPKTGRGAEKAERALDTSSAGPGKQPVPATPATRRLARELGVDLRQVEPSGENGRVLEEDVRAHAESKPERSEQGEAPERRGAPRREAAPQLPDFTEWGPVERQPLRSIRRQIARRMALSWSQIPHVTHQDVADVTELEQFRRRHVAEVEEAGGKLTLTVLIMKALVAVLHEFPRFNASLDMESEELVFKKYYDIGVALDTERGLLVPVIRDVPSKSMTELGVELVQLAERARAGEVSRNEMRGGTFTITNVGPLGGTGFTPIINYPEVAILGVARAELRPVVRGSLESPELSTRLVLPLSLGFDHRVNDGADAARFVNRLTEILSDPERLAVLA